MHPPILEADKHQINQAKVPKVLAEWRGGKDPMGYSV